MKHLTDIQKSIVDQKIQISEDKFVIRLNYMKADDPNRNVYCVTASNEILWQIEADPKRTKIPGGLDLDTFVHVKFDGKELVADRFSGFVYSVNLHTGKIHETGWHK